MARTGLGYSLTAGALGLAAAFAVAISSAHAQTAAAAKDWRKEWSDTVAKAAGQELMLAVHPVSGNVAIANAFQARFPKIKLRLMQISANVFAPRVLAEQRGKIYAWDGWLGQISNLNSMLIPAEGFERIDRLLILPEGSDPQQWRSQRYRYTSPKGPYIFVVNLSYANAVFGNRSALIGWLPQTADELLDPRLKGKIAIRSPDRVTSGADTLGALLKAKGPAFIRRLLTEMQPAIMDNPRQVTQAVMSGDKAVVFGAEPDLVNQCKSAGGCRAVERLTVGAGVLLPRGAAILKNPPNREAATVWINWLLSREGQSVYVREMAKSNPSGASSMRKDVAPAPVPEAQIPADYDDTGSTFVAHLGDDAKYIAEASKIFRELRSARR